MSKYIHIGKIVASIGLKGELLLKHALGKKTSFKINDVLFLEKEKNIQLPYFIEDSKARNITETVLKLEGVDTKEKTNLLLQKKVWLTTEEFEKQVSKTAPLHLIDFTVFENKKELGKVQAVIEQPLQTLLQISVQEKEVLIPVHEQTLKKIDRKNKEIHVELPEGLLDIYLGK